MKTIIILITGLLITGCSNGDITGRWVDGTGDMLIFNRSGEFKIDSPDAAEADGWVEWQTVTSLASPNQLYLIYHKSDGSNERIPFGIYKVSGGELILAAAITHYTTPAAWMTFPTGYSLPDDFSRGVEVFRRETAREAKASIEKAAIKYTEKEMREYREWLAEQQQPPVVEEPESDLMPPEKAARLMEEAEAKYQNAVEAIAAEVTAPEPINFSGTPLQPSTEKAEYLKMVATPEYQEPANAHTDALVRQQMLPKKRVSDVVDFRKQQPSV